MKIEVAKDFTTTPGGRYIEMGKYSGEAFYKEILKPKLSDFVSQGLSKDNKLHIDLDNTKGYPSSFISEAFGKINDDFKNMNIWDYIEIKSEDEEMLIDYIKEIIETYE